MVASMGILGKFHDPKIELLGSYLLRPETFVVGTSPIFFAAPEMANENIT